MTKRTTLRNALCTLLLAASVPAAAQEAKEKYLTPIKRGYWTGNYDAGIFSTAFFERPGVENKMTTLRFSYFFNAGANFNYDFSKSAGLMAGAGIKNIGFIEKISANDSTVKRRVYTLGIQLALKFGDMQRQNYFFVGGGADAPFNYKEKGFVKRSDKIKFDEWFSERTPSVMPHVFAGLSFARGFVAKVQYYPTNFFNEDFTENVNGTEVKPYTGYKSNILYFSLGKTMKYKKKKKATGTI